MNIDFYQKGYSDYFSLSYPELPMSQKDRYLYRMGWMRASSDTAHNLKSEKDAEEVVSEV